MARKQVRSVSVMCGHYFPAARVSARAHSRLKASLCTCSRKQCGPLLELKAEGGFGAGRLEADGPGFSPMCRLPRADLKGHRVQILCNSFHSCQRLNTVTATLQRLIFACLAGITIIIRHNLLMVTR